MKYKALVFLSCLSIILFARTELLSQASPKKHRKMSYFMPHPGTIRMIDDDNQSVRIVKADDVPLRRRFVFLDKSGNEVEADDKSAVERIPIVEVQMTPTDGDGHVVPREQARLIRIKEFGPEKRPLRSVTMTKN